MANGVQVIVLFDRVQLLADHLPELAAKGLDKGCAEMESIARNSAPVVTGALRDSGYRITALTDEFAQAVSAAQGDNPKAGFVDKPEVGPDEAVVGFAVDYAGFVSEGTRYMSGNPFFTNAQEQAMEPLVEGVEDEINKAAAGAAI